MAIEHRPLVLIDGNWEQLPVGDVIAQDTIEELEMSYAQRTDFVGDTIIYKGWADVGELESATTWRIQKIEFVGVDGDIVITWAEGDNNFDNVWNDRLIYTYS